MRALYLENIDTEIFEIDGEKVHHLLNVVRIKENDEILLLNGRGESRLVIVAKVHKKKISLIPITATKTYPKKRREIAIAIPKKEALELCLKQAVELAITKIYLIQSQYSQKNNLTDERVQNILISALEQSNNHWLPEIELLNNIEEFLEKEIKFAYFSSQTNNSKRLNLTTPDLALLIGPEAGFSSAEETRLIEASSINIHFEGAIMRTPTALACGIGFLKALN